MKDAESESISTLEEKVRELQKRALEKSAREKELNAELLPELLPPNSQENEPTAPQPHAESALERAQLNLFNMERVGRFDAIPISPSNEFPTFLTRVPIFIPNSRSSQNNMLDEDNSLPFKTSWGTGRRFGPPLNTYDEDTLFALAKLRQNLLVGSPSKMPVPVSEMYADTQDHKVHVHTVFCKLVDIERVCGNTRGTKNYEKRLASIKRLAATRIELDQKTRSKLELSETRKGTFIGLLDVHWETFEQDAVLFIQFHPIVANWLENFRTYIDFEIRQKLDPVGKAVHRFLSGQPKTYSINVVKLRDTIHYLGEHKKFMAKLRACLKKLQNEGWIEAWEITGTGRRIPHKLSIIR